MPLEGNSYKIGQRHSALTEEMKLTLNIVARALGMTIKAYQVQCRMREYVELRMIGAKIVKERYGFAVFWEDISDYYQQDYSTVRKNYDRTNALLEAQDGILKEKYLKALMEVTIWQPRN